MKALLAVIALMMALTFGTATLVQADEKPASAPTAPVAPAEKKEEMKKEEGKKAEKKESKKKEKK